jgi:hypothetical protein
MRSCEELAGSGYSAASPVASFPQAVRSYSTAQQELDQHSCGGLARTSEPCWLRGGINPLLYAWTPVVPAAGHKKAHRGHLRRF